MTAKQAFKIYGNDSDELDDQLDEDWGKMKKKKCSRTKKKVPAGAETLRIVKIESLAGGNESMESTEQQSFGGQLSYGKHSKVSTDTMKNNILLSSDQ